MKVKLEFFKCMGIMLANLCHPYILSSTVLSDNVGCARKKAIFVKPLCSLWRENQPNQLRICKLVLAYRDRSPPDGGIRSYNGGQASSRAMSKTQFSTCS